LESILALATVLLSVTAPAPAEQAVANLRAFAKLYGYIRYFHPSDEASAVDWDRLAVHGVARVKGARDARELRSALDELFAPVAPTLRLFPSSEPPPAIKLPAAAPESAVYWQHLGYGFGSSRSVYTSLRRNRQRELVAAGGSFGTTTAHVPAGPHRGKAIRLSALVRTEVVGTGNQAQLWLRVDREGKDPSFFDNMEDRPITSREWKRYEIRGTVGAEASDIVFGGFLAGGGKVWLDDFHLDVESTPGTWSPIAVENAGFEATSDGKPWYTQAAGYKLSVVSDGAGEGKRAMLIEQGREVLGRSLFDGGPAPGELITKELGSGISCRFPLALPTDKGHTFGRPRRPLAALSRTLGAIDLPKLTGDDERVRLADVVIAWNVFQHFYPYFDVVRVDWDGVLTRALEMALANRSHDELRKTLRWLVAQLQDGHGSVRDSRSPPPGPLPWRIEFIEGQVVVLAAPAATKLLPGDVVESVNGQPVKALLEEDEPFVSGSPQWRQVKMLQRLGQAPPGTTVEVAVRRGGQTVTARLTTAAERYLPEKLRPSVEKLAGGVWYVDLDRAPWSDISPRLAEIAAAPGVIFDLRGYPRNNHAVIGHLLSAKDSDEWMMVPQIVYPDRERIAGYQKHGWSVAPLAPHIKGKVAFITGPMAISYAESVMGFVEHYKLGDIVGQPTAGANGNVNPFDLPGGFSLTWTGMKVVRHDGSQQHLIGIRPTMPAERTIEGVRRGRDEPFEAALRLVSKPAPPQKR
jgi:C-terminal processing protease CtpA/Prc